MWAHLVDQGLHVTGITGMAHRQMQSPDEACRRLGDAPGLAPNLHGAMAFALAHGGHGGIIRIDDDSWHRGLAVGSGSAEGGCKHVMQRCFKRAGMRWKQAGFLNVLALRLASLNGTFEAFWPSHGLPVQPSVVPTK